MNPIKVCYSFEELDNFIKDNQALLERDAGFAGYISYEGDMEWVIFEKILNKNLTPSYEDIVVTGSIQQPDAQNFINNVKRCQEYIKEGDVYQANLAHKFIIESKNSGKEIYHKLKSLNPAPYMGFMDYSRYQIISSSPESFIKIYRNNSDWHITSSPIKGTATLNELRDLTLSAKEKAEHIMIVDLIRNDLSKICKTGSVNVLEMLGAHKFSNLYHLVSVVEGLLVELNFSKIFSSLFPGGSITGAPKIRAMEIIKELEANPRGPYTGAMGYFRFKDGGEFSILIRTLVLDKTSGELSLHSGAGITAYSDPEKEYQETLLKAQKILEVFS